MGARERELERELEHLRAENDRLKSKSNGHPVGGGGGNGNGSGNGPVSPDFVAELVAARRRAEALSTDLKRQKEQKDHFIAVLSHELRNPLAAIRSALEIMRIGTRQDSVERARRVIERQTQHLARMVSDLLDVSRAISGTIELRKKRVDLRELVAQVVEDHRNGIEAAGIAMRYLACPQSVWVELDRRRMAQAITGIVANAGKFTESGGSIEVQVDGDGTLTVRDTGIGIDPEKIASLLEPFAQIDKSLDRTQGGLGLGLALAQRLTELHGGRLEISSAGLGRGTQVMLTLPLLEDEARETPAVEPEQRDTILVIEDNRDVADTMAELLETMGHRVKTCYTGEDGLAAAERLKPRIILCDLGLPGLDGFEVARRVRANPELSSARMIAISGYGQIEDRRRSLASGFDAHLTKPVEISDLQTLVETGEVPVSNNH